MDPSQHQSPQQAGGHRDVVYCHECENEWYRDEHGLICPECQSDFTEIIEEAHDPRGDLMLPDHDSDASHEEHDRDTEDHGHQHWADVPDPDEGNINEFHWQSTGPGRFTVHGTFYRTIPRGPLGGSLGNIPGQRANTGPQQEGITQNFMSMLQGILGNHRMANQNQSQNQNPGFGEQLAAGQPLGQNQDNNSPFRVVQGGGPNHRFTYTSNARIFPRDANGPTRVEPADDLTAILGAMFGPEAFGELPNRQGQQPGQPGQQQQGGGPPPPFNPFAALFGHLMNPGGVHGDVVYSQEALDRVISQLMEQNATGNAPGPASADAISSLPKRQVTIEDLGSDGKAECSICMDEVDVGEEVTVLPCTHWFHGQCVAMWLGEHDTCPHCRKGITSKPSETASGQPGQGGNGNSNAGPSSSYPSSPSHHNFQPPGGFFSGSTSPRGPNSPSDQRPNNDRRRSDGSSNSGGIAGRIRRGLFGGGSSGS